MPCNLPVISDIRIGYVYYTGDSKEPGDSARMWMCCGQASCPQHIHILWTSLLSPPSASGLAHTATRLYGDDIYTYLRETQRHRQILTQHMSVDSMKRMAFLHPLSPSDFSATLFLPLLTYIYLSLSPPVDSVGKSGVWYR
jgi:hypothetical protein